jgi:periplasmic protein TonB
MRTYTIVFSICAHALAVGTLIIVPALATDDLPEPRRTTAFIAVQPAPPPPVPIQTRTQQTPQSVPDRVVTVPHVGTVPAEEVVESVDDVADLGAGLTGTSLGGSVPNADPIPPPPPPPAPPVPKDPVHVGGNIQPPKRLSYVGPVYPPIALAARKEGLVILEALIAEDGTIRDVRVLRSDPLFEQAAIAAVRQWRFSPTRLNGQPVPVVMTVTVGFDLD